VKTDLFSKFRWDGNILITNKLCAGGIITARLLFFISFVLVLPITTNCVSISGNQTSLSIENLPYFSVAENSAAFELKFSYEGDAPEIPQTLDKIVSYEGKNLVVVKIALEKQPSMTFVNGTLKISWRSSDSSVSSIFDIKTPPFYPLGSGDKLLVEVYGIEEIKKEVVVDPTGYVTLPLLDKLKVQGLTLNELQKLLEEKFGDFIKEPQINVQLMEYGSRFVNIIGEVEHPIRIPLKRALRLLDAISEAGGFSEKSGDIEVQRRDSDSVLQKLIISKDSLLSAGQGNENIYLFDQDTINVLPVNSVYISGQVVAPKAIPFTKELTLLRAIALAGGFTQWAKQDKIIILRKDSPGEAKTLKVDANKIAKGKTEDVPLLPNDQIIVYERKLF
jgi:polysaccharide biosynthesis/export protein